MLDAKSPWNPNSKFDSKPDSWTGPQTPNTHVCPTTNADGKTLSPFPSLEPHARDKIGPEALIPKFESFSVILKLDPKPQILKLVYQPRSKSKAPLPMPDLEPTPIINLDPHCDCVVRSESLTLEPDSKLQCQNQTPNPKSEVRVKTLNPNTEARPQTTFQLKLGLGKGWSAVVGWRCGVLLDLWKMLKTGEMLNMLDLFGTPPEKCLKQGEC